MENERIAAARALAWAEYVARSEGTALRECIPLDAHKLIWEVAFTQGIIANLEIVS